jgi:hypothetical protein
VLLANKQALRYTMVSLELRSVTCTHLSLNAENLRIKTNYVSFCKRLCTMYEVCMSEKYTRAVSIQICVRERARVRVRT